MLGEGEKGTSESTTKTAGSGAPPGEEGSKQLKDALIAGNLDGANDLLRGGAMLDGELIESLYAIAELWAERWAERCFSRCDLTDTMELLLESLARQDPTSFENLIGEVANSERNSLKEFIITTFPLLEVYPKCAVKLVRSAPDATADVASVAAAAAELPAAGGAGSGVPLDEGDPLLDALEEWRVDRVNTLLENGVKLSKEMIGCLYRVAKIYSKLEPAVYTMSNLDRTMALMLESLARQDLNAFKGLIRDVFTSKYDPLKTFVAASFSALNPSSREMLYTLMHPIRHRDVACFNDSAVAARAARIGAEAPKTLIEALTTWNLEAANAFLEREVRFDKSMIDDLYKIAKTWSGLHPRIYTKLKLNHMMASILESLDKQDHASYEKVVRDLFSSEDASHNTFKEFMAKSLAVSTFSEEDLVKLLQSAYSPAPAAAVAVAAAPPPPPTPTTTIPHINISAKGSVGATIISDGVAEALARTTRDSAIASAIVTIKNAKECLSEMGRKSPSRPRSESCFAL